MECSICKHKKLSKEFPPFPWTEDCQHPLLTCCIRCVLRAASEGKRKCPNPSCSAFMKKGSKEIEILKCIVTTMFKEYDTSYTAERHCKTKEVFIRTLNATCMVLEYDGNAEIFQLKKEIKEQMNVEIKFQKLLFNGQTLQNIDENGRRCKLEDYGVKAGDIIYLVKLLCELPSDIKNVKFRIKWGYPTTKETIFWGLISYTKHHEDYLDASCFVFKNKVHIACVYVENREYEGVRHEKEDTWFWKNIGEHIMSVSLENVEEDVTHLFFTLSARDRTRVVSNYVNPVLQVFESKTNTSLCKTSLDGFSNQAIIICCVYRAEDFVWRISDVRQSCSGNIYDRSQLVSKMVSIINDKTF